MRYLRFHQCREYTRLMWRERLADATKGELEGSVVYCSDNQTEKLGKEVAGYICTGSSTRPTIDTTYFPNTQSSWFWSSSPSANFVVCQL